MVAEISMTSFPDKPPHEASQKLTPLCQKENWNLADQSFPSTCTCGGQCSSLVKTAIRIPLYSATFILSVSFSFWRFASITHATCHTAKCSRLSRTQRAGMLRRLALDRQQVSPATRPDEALLSHWRQRWIVQLAGDLRPACKAWRTQMSAREPGPRSGPLML